MEVDPALRDRGAVLAALAYARDLAAAEVSTALALAPPLGGDDDPRWYADPGVAHALDGWGDPDVHPLRVQVVLWPAHTSLLTAGDLPPGVAVYAEPDPVGELSRGAPFAPPVGEPTAGYPPEARAAAPGRARAGRAPDVARRGATATPRRTPVEAVVDLSEARHLWQGDLQIDTAYEVLRAAAEARAGAHGDVTVVDETIGGPEHRLVFVLRVGLPDVTPTTPIDALVAQGAAAMSAVRSPLRRLERTIDAAVRATHVRLRRG